MVFLKMLLTTKFQSTHPHGVRLFIKVSNSFHSCFNPRTHTGCDALQLGIPSEVIMFQSTHPHGVRRSFARTRDGVVTFQSTHPHGVRPLWTYPARVAFMFQSTHPHGVRLEFYGDGSGVAFVSIHAPTRGATYNLRQMQRHFRVSIHAPTRGATGRQRDRREPDWFQSTHPHGVRRG